MATRLGHPLERLGPHLATLLDPDAQATVTLQIAVLRAITRVRNAIQHPGADTDGLDALHELGVPYPIFDWTAAWDAIRERAIIAVGVIRDELSAVAN